jgi:hypothetical protein
MNQMIDPSESLRKNLLIGVLLGIVVAIYWPGLTGGFVLDDYAQIVINDALMLPKGWSLSDLLAALASSDAGPFGRPVAMATLAVQRTLHGLDPWYFKLFNLGVHVVNVLLVFVLARQLYGVAFPDRSGIDENRRYYAALLAAALWGLHPFNLTGVLYVVQRMTSLSSMFSLLALLFYLRFRQDHSSLLRRVIYIAGFALSFAGAVLSKETALLIPVFCFVIEFLFFGFKRSIGSYSRIAVAGYGSMFIVPVLWFAYKTWVNVDWLGQMYAGRPFDLEQRLFTESIIVWFYLRNIVLPDVNSMGLHHDDFPLFGNLFADPLVVVSLLGHFVLLLMAWKVRGRHKLVAFAVFFYYAGHLLESTLWPLELVYEHRNYLPMVGFAIMGGWYIPVLLMKFSNIRGAVIISSLLAIFLAGATVIRSSHWGDAVTFAMVEAEKHPQSGRANFDAGRELVVLMLRLKGVESQLGLMALGYLEKSIGKGMVTVEPYLVGYQAKAQLGIDLPEGFFEKFCHQLNSGYLPNGLYGLSVGLLGLSRFENPPLSQDALQQLFEETLKNPRVVGIARGHVLTTYSIFSAEAQGDLVKSYSLAKKATQIAPGFIPFKQNAALMAYAAGQKDHALGLLSEVEESDKIGLFKRETTRLKSIMNNAG